MLRSIAFVGVLTLVLGACDSGPDDAVQETAASAVPSEAATPRQLPGEVVRTHAGTQLPDLAFEDPQGNTLDLGEQDRPTLVNLWATWCAPCVIEMPSLDSLAGEFEGELDVLTVSQDARGAELVEPFFAERDFQYLEQWLDPQNELSSALTDGGLLPVTILFDAQGREILRVSGGYEWDSEEAIAMVSEALEEASSAS